jgi:group I intron endonuclease
VHVYLLINKVNFKYYVGMTGKENLTAYVKRCFADAERGRTNKPHIYAAVRKHGRENFIICSLRNDITDPKELAVQEQFYIKALRANDKLVGYNVSRGGEGPFGVTPWNKGKKMDAAYCERIRQAVQPYHSSEKIHPLKGIVRSPEMRKRISETLKAKGFRPSVAACRKGGQVRQSVAA